MLREVGSPLSLFLVPRFLLPRDDQVLPSCCEGCVSEPPNFPLVLQSSQPPRFSMQLCLPGSQFCRKQDLKCLTQISILHICSTKDLFPHALVPQTNASASLAP